MAWTQRIQGPGSPGQAESLYLCSSVLLFLLWRRRGDPVLHIRVINGLPLPFHFFFSYSIGLWARLLHTAERKRPEFCIKQVYNVPVMRDYKPEELYLHHCWLAKGIGMQINGVHLWLVIWFHMVTLLNYGWLEPEEPDIWMHLVREDVTMLKLVFTC